MLANLEQYGLEDRYLDVLVGDFACCVWRSPGEIFDAIVTDREFLESCLLLPALGFKTVPWLLYDELCADWSGCGLIPGSPIWN